MTFDKSSAGKLGTSSCSDTKELSLAAPIAIGKWPRWFTRWASTVSAHKAIAFWPLEVVLLGERSVLGECSGKSSDAIVGSKSSGDIALGEVVWTVEPVIIV